MVSMLENDDEDSGTNMRFTAAIRITSIVAEYALAAVLCAETLATQSLWMSVGTHAACMLATIYALKGGLGGNGDGDNNGVGDDNNMGSQAAKTTANASARDTV